MYDLRFILLVCIFLSGCLPKGGDDPTQFDCSTENPTYQVILENQEEWIEGFRALGPNVGEYRFTSGIDVTLRGPSGYSNEFAVNFDKWDQIDKLLMVQTAFDNVFDGAYYGRGGSFGFIYSERIDPIPIFDEYTITRLTDNVYCYIIKDEYIQSSQ